MIGGNNDMVSLTRQKYAMGHDSSVVRLAKNGLAAYTADSAIVATFPQSLSSIYLGIGSTGAGALNGWLHQFAVFPRAPANDAECVAKASAA